MNKEGNKINIIFIAGFFLLIFNPGLALIVFTVLAIYYKKNPTELRSKFLEYQQVFMGKQTGTNRDNDIGNASITTISSIPFSILSHKQVKLEKRKKYLHIALNSDLGEARSIISMLPASDRILIEVGTPLIKIYGSDAISRIKNMAPSGAYIVADIKCADLAAKEVELASIAGANAATCLGVAPIETIDAFIEECDKASIDSMLDMMNVENALVTLRKLKKLPSVVILHRGVDETEFTKEKQIPYYQIKQIKGSFDVLVAVAGGDSINEVQKAIFNDADIVVVWKNFYKSSSDTAELARQFLKEIK